MSRAVHLELASVACAAGRDVGAVWQAIAADRRCLRDPQLRAMSGAGWPQAFLVDDPDLAAQGVDRRVLRTMEKQARLAMDGAGLALRDSAAFHACDRARFGLYLGLPVVDDPVPPWPVLQAMHEQRLPALTTELCLQHTPPFSALSELNSSAGAHIAARHGMTGAFGFFAPEADAGLQAVIEAALSIVEGENDAALAGGVAPKVDPLLWLRHEHRGWLRDPARLPGEGAAFAVLAAGAGAPGLRVAGHARGFVVDAAGPAAARRRDGIAGQAAATAGIPASAIGWTLASEALWPWCGDLGPATPVLALGLAAHGLRARRRLRLDGPPAEVPMEEPCALVTVQAHEGQCAAVLLVREDA